MGLRELLARMESRAVTPVTAAVTPDVTPNALQTGSCTAVTPVTAINNVTANESTPVGAGDTPLIAANADTVTPFDFETFEERAAIAEFDGGLDRDDAESLAWDEDNRRSCTQCTNRRYDGVCNVAAPVKGARVIANKSYIPDAVLMRRCEGYMPKASDNDQRPGAERWPGLFQEGGE